MSAMQTVSLYGCKAVLKRCMVYFMQKRGNLMGKIHNVEKNDR